MMSTEFGKAVTAEDYQSWKQGLIERIITMMEKAALIDQKIDILPVQPVPGAKQAILPFLVSDSEYGQQTYIFTIASMGPDDEYHVFPPADFVSEHEGKPDMPDGYTLGQPEWIDRLLVDLGRNCQVDGEIDREMFVVRKHMEYWLQ